MKNWPKNPNILGQKPTFENVFGQKKPRYLGVFWAFGQKPNYFYY